MTRLELIIILVLQFEGISGADIHLYYRPGDDAILPCEDVLFSDRVCATVNWIYSRDSLSTFDLVQNGNVVDNSARAARMSLDTSCSLIISNITVEDVGHYTCRTSPDLASVVLLSIITISQSPPDADPMSDDKVTLECSLLRYIRLRPCLRNSIRWMNETGTVLRGEGIRYEFPFELMKCVSPLTVKRQSSHNRTYTCQVVERNQVQMEVDYTPVFTEVTSDDQPDESNTDPSLYIITGVVVAVMVVVVIVITAVFIKFRHTATEDLPKTVNLPEPQDEPDGSLTYVTVNHPKQKTTSKKKVKEERVTYSTVKTAMTTVGDDDPSRIYSNVNEIKINEGRRKRK